MAKKQDETEQKPVLHYVVGVWSILRPDTRQYKQQSVEIELSQPVAVEVPAEMVFKTVTTPEGEVQDILTPEGLIHVQQQFEKLYNALNPAEEATGEWKDEDTPKTDGSVGKAESMSMKEADEWDSQDGFDTPVPKAEATAEDDGWATDGAVFDDNDGFVGNEPDTETKEDWDLDKEWDK